MNDFGSNEMLQAMMGQNASTGTIEPLSMDTLLKLLMAQTKRTADSGFASAMANANSYSPPSGRSLSWLLNGLPNTPSPWSSK